jgi:hypothetical protein
MACLNALHDTIRFMLPLLALCLSAHAAGYMPSITLSRFPIPGHSHTLIPSFCPK